MHLAPVSGGSIRTILGLIPNGVGKIVYGFLLLSVWPKWWLPELAYQRHTSLRGLHLSRFCNVWRLPSGDRYL